MNLGVIVSRVSQFPVLESTVAAAVRRGHTVGVFLDQRSADSQTPREWPARWAEFPLRARLVDSFVEPLPRDLFLDAIVKNYTPGFSVATLRADGWPGKVVHVQGVISDIMGLDVAPYDRVYAWAPGWAGYFAEWNNLPAPKNFVAVGHTQADLLGDRSRIPGSGAVVYCPFPRATLKRAWWSHGVFTQPWPFLATERKIVTALRRYCDRLHLEFVVKGLARRGVTRWIEKAADVVVWDKPGEPGMLWLLHERGVLLVHYLSTSVAEAAVAGVPSLCLVSPHFSQYAKRLRLPTFSAPTDASPVRSFYSWGSVARAMTPRQAIDCFDHLRLVPGDPPVMASTMADYRCAFVGEPPWNAGERIIKDLEEITK